MLKIKDNVDFNEILKMSNFDYEADCDYEAGYSYAIYFDGNIVLDVSDDVNVFIRGIDNSEFDLLYDLIKAGLVEKVEDK